jgi:hypothetical protein
VWKDIIKRFLKKQAGRTWTELIWLRIGKNDAVINLRFYNVRGIS